MTSLLVIISVIVILIITSFIYLNMLFKHMVKELTPLKTKMFTEYKQIINVMKNCETVDQFNVAKKWGTSIIEKYKEHYNANNMSSVELSFYYRIIRPYANLIIEEIKNMEHK